MQFPCNSHAIPMQLYDWWLDVGALRMWVGLSAGARIMGFDLGQERL
jgi:hypothetical protein